MTNPSTPPPGRGPADRNRLAHALREARQSAGLPGVEAGRQAGMSQSKISKIERGFLLPSIDDVAALCRLYGVSSDERENLLAIAAGLREEASSKVILARGMAGMQRRIGHLEGSACLVRSFQPAMVIGLLQTPAYARCVFGTPAPHTPPGTEVDEAVAARAARQRVLEDQSKRFTLLMSEGALRWQAGSADIMADQLDAIAAAAKLPHVRIGLIPWTTPVRLFPRHGFHIYDQDAVIVGTETATATITGAADIATYTRLFAELEASAAFDDHAAPHLARIANEYRQLSDAR
jgi:transcriptional regulator with XRE-family HTH domain